MKNKQWVCLVCGYNMIGRMPDICPFCGAHHNQFLDWEEAERRYQVQVQRINDRVAQLLSVPRLGYEHAAYRIEMDSGPVWIDCPSVFNRNLTPPRAIYFTHMDFMGACNQYQEVAGTRISLHELDAAHSLAAAFTVDNRFHGDFCEEGIEAFHVDGHTPGFTIYIHHTVLFVCDYVLIPKAGRRMQFNKFGHREHLYEGAALISKIMDRHVLETVCGWNYIMDYKQWRTAFDKATEALGSNGIR